MYQNYIFDLYGTLVDIRTDEYSRSFWRRAVMVFAKHRASFTPVELRMKYHKFVRREFQLMRLSHPFYLWYDIDLMRVFARLYHDKGIAPDAALLRETAIDFRKTSTELLRLYDGVPELLTALKNAGKRIYLLTNAQECFTMPELEELDILRFFDGVMISSQEGISKPQRQIFERLIEKYHLDRSRSIMIGNDKESDMRGAEAAGIDGLYIHQAISPPVKDEREIHAKWKIMDSDVHKILDCVLRQPEVTS